MQALTPADNICSSSTATAEEAILAAAVRLALTAWQARLPLGDLLVAPAMTQRHRLMLLHLMVVAETGASSCCTGITHSGGAPSCTKRSVLLPHEASMCSADSIVPALEQYGLLKVDLYQDVLLSACAAQPNPADSDQDTPERASQTEAYATMDSPGALQHLSSAGMQAASIAELLVWLSRSGQTAAVLQRVLEIAKAEEQLAQQVGTMH